MARGKKNVAEEYAENLRRTMLENLSARGLVEPIYEDKVNEYTNLYLHRQTAKQLVDTMGITVIDDNGRVSENPAARAERDYSRCMLNIFKGLGFNEAVTGNVTGGDEDDEL